jgi:hypothetical protein
MTTLRRFVFAALLALTALNFAPSLASAQEAHGTFLLGRDVHWQNANVPAGEYRFSYDPARPLGVLMLTRMGSASAGFIVMVPNTDFADGSGSARLVLKTSAAATYVTDMRLPEYGMALHFNTPRPTEKQMAKASTSTMAAAQ